MSLQYGVSLRLDAVEGVCRIWPSRVGDRFQDYRLCIEGSVFDREKRNSACGLDKVPAILKRLRVAGFAVDAKADLVERLQKRTAEAWMDLQNVRDRIEAIDEEIRSLAATKGIRRGMAPYQKIGACWMAIRTGALLADDQGVGKTLQCIAALPARARTVVVCPLSVKGEWVKEVAKWRPHLKVTTMSGRGSFRWPNEGEIAVYNYQILPSPHSDGCDGKLPPGPCQGCHAKLVFEGGRTRTAIEGHMPLCTGKESDDKRLPCPGCASHLRNAPEGVVVVGDEAQNVKNPKSQMTQAFRAVASAARANQGKTWLLSGTPIENKPQELWAVYSAAGIAQEAFGTYERFAGLFNATRKSVRHNGPVVYVFGTPTLEQQPELVERMQRVSLRRTRPEVLPDLPGKMHKQIEVEIDARVLAKANKLMAEAGGLERIAAAFEKLANDDEPEFKNMSSLRQALSVAKIPAMLERVKEVEAEGEPLVVFSWFRAPLDALDKRKGWMSISGDTPQNKRVEAIDLFQAGKLKGLACMIQAAGTGITLHRSNRMLFVDRAWTNSKNAQAEDRCVRLGQHRGTIIDVLVANHALDRRVTEVLLEKQALFDSSVQAARTDEGAVESEKAEAERFVQQLKEVQEEVAIGRAVRRMAETDEERWAVQALSTRTFKDRRDGRFAADLLEQAHLVGLSDRQWPFAVDVARRGDEAEDTLVKTASAAPSSEPVTDEAARRDER